MKRRLRHKDRDTGMYISEVRTHPLTMHKINSKWLKVLIIRNDTIKLLVEIIGKTFSDISYTNVFLGQSPKVIGNISKKIQIEASLVAQWQRIHLPVQETQNSSLVQEDSHMHKAIKSMCHN